MTCVGALMILPPHARSPPYDLRAYARQNRRAPVRVANQPVSNTRLKYSRLRVAITSGPSSNLNTSTERYPS